MPARTANPRRPREGAPPRTAYTIPEVAESLGLSRRQVYRLAERDELPTCRIGGKLLVLADEFDKFLQQQKAAS